MKIRIKYLILVMFLFNCKSYNSLKMEIDKNKAIPYNEYSREFQEWESTKNIKLEEAYQIHLSYASENQDRIKLKSKEGYPLFCLRRLLHIFNSNIYS